MRTRKRKAPNRRKLTDANVCTLPIKSTWYHVWDTRQEGLAVQVMPSGIRTYRCAWNYPNGPSRMFALGRVEDIDLDEARRRCADARRLAKDGKDPQAGDPKRTKTFKVLFRLYTKDRVADKSVTADRTETWVLNSCERWHYRPVGTITWPEIKELLTEKRDTAVHAANRLHKQLGSFFKWCAGNDVIAASPMYGRALPSKAANNERREFDWVNREKGDEAIKAIWDAADTIGGDEGRHLKLVLVLGKRRSAIENMDWKRIGADWFWNPPPGNVIKRLHAVPLPKLAQRILSPRKDEGRVFPHSIDTKAVVARVRALTGLDDWIYHACRHLAETKMAELLVPPHIRDLLLDHSSTRGAGKGYDHHSYWPEMSEALERWAAHIERVVAPADNVSVLR